MRLLLAFLSASVAVVAQDFPKPFNTGTDVGLKPMPASEAVKLIKMPEGFTATVFASEPEVQNPIACAWDSRGRLWVAENYTYADRQTNFDKTLRDRILIFEDTDNDGKADKRTVFHEGLQNLTSIELGYGGVYATAAPRLVFIPDKNGDDKPDSEPETLLDGFDAWSVRHNFVNGLKWGPDGWLYGRHGIQATSKVGAPGTPEKDRATLNCGIWKFHPVKKTFEIVCWGGTNSWGHDWNEDGEGFFINTVIGHAYHIVPGAHYERMYGQDPTPHTYELLPQTADHYHFDTSAGWTNSRDGKANDLGGGHAHSGCLIYLGDNWPELYRHKLLTINFHGRRINMERPERSKSGYVLKHEHDALQFGDPWFRGVELSMGPDGAVFVLDWSDQGECHENDGVHRESGRIYKISHGPQRKLVLGKENDVAAKTDAQLLTLATEGNEWFSRMARRILAERAATRESAKRIDESAIAPVKALLTAEKPLPATRLRALLALHAAGAAKADDYATALTARDNTRKDEGSIAWAVRLIAESPELTKELAERLIKHTHLNNLPLVRLAYASCLDRFPENVRSQVFLHHFINHPEDADDAVMVNVLWHTLRNGSADELKTLAMRSTGTMVRWATRRLASEPKSADQLATVLRETAKQSDKFQKPVLLGFHDAYRGQAKAVKPQGWDEFAAKAAGDFQLADKVRELNVIFGDGRALDEIRKLALDSKTEFNARKQALESLTAANPPDLRTTLNTLLKDGDLLPFTLAALAKYEDAGATIVDNYKRVRADGRAGVMAALCSRPVFARALLEALAAGTIPRPDVTPYHARQIASLGDAEVSKQLAEVWGTLASTSGQKKKRIEELKHALSPETLKAADLAKGRELFIQSCAACHTLYELGQQGTNLGPNLTGAGRDNLDYLLENMVDPSAMVPADFKLSTVTLKDGRILSGFIAARDAKALTLRTMTDTQTLPWETVGKTEASAQSLMPEGLLDALSEEQRRDLIAFLMRK